MSVSVSAFAKTLLSHQIVRFLITGVLNTGFGYIVYLAGIFAGLTPTVALAVATVIGACFNYFSTGRLVFNHSSIRQLPQFLLAYACIYVLNVLMLRGLISLGVGPALAQALLTPVVAALSFVIMKLLVFRQERKI